MMSSILVLAALAMGAAAETFSGVASYNTIWGPNLACGGDYDKSKFLLAMGQAKYGSMVNGNTSPVCGHTITVNYQGKSLVATIVDRMVNPRVNGIDLSESAFIELAGGTKAGLLDVTWSWNDGFDPATGTQSMAGLEAVALPGKAGGISDGSAPAATSSVATVASSVATSDAAGTSALASDTALAAGADAAATSSTTGAVASVDPSPSPAVPVASVHTAANAVVPAASSSTSSTSTSEPAPAGTAGRPTGYGGHRKDRQRRCAAQL